MRSEEEILGGDSRSSPPILVLVAQCITWRRLEEEDGRVGLMWESIPWIQSALCTRWR